MKKKPTFMLKTLKSFIVSSLHWQMLQFQSFTPRFQAFSLSIRSSSMEPTLCKCSKSSGILRVLSKPSLRIKNLIKSVLEVWGLGCKSYRRPKARLKNWGNKKPTAIKKLMRFFIIRAYRLYRKLFKRSWLAVTTTMLWPAILALKKLANY